MKNDAFFWSTSGFDAAKFEAFRQQNPQGFAAAREQARDFLRFQRHFREVAERMAPDSRALAAEARLKGTTARVRYVQLADFHYDGEHDPDDDAVRAYYRDHKDELSRQPEATFTALALRVPRYSTAPNTIVPRGSP